ncbi:MAG TPA: TonB-dependent receptor, partial [Wenzhouxiangella sp.]|nr:TonB-dependent receptor [Wenzhouxiangella sp.]
MSVGLFMVGVGVVQAAQEEADVRSGSSRVETTEDRVAVTVTRVDRPLLEAPAAVSKVSQEALQTARQQLQLEEALNRVPGVFFQNRYNFAQNQRIAIRGFGARSPFGIRGIRLLVDGFPETLPDGQAQVDGIDLESVTSAEILRGPSSALYGNAAGGVISLSTEDGQGLEPTTELRATLGNYGFRRLGVQAGGEFDDWNTYISAWDLRYEGYREQSETEKRLLNAHVGHQLDADRRIGFVLTALDQPRGEDPSALTRAQVEENRRAAGGQAVQVDSRQVVDQYRLGLRYEDSDLLSGRFEAYAFVAERDFFQQLPSSFFPSLIEFDRKFAGLGLQYGRPLQLANLPARYTVGFDLARQRDDRRRFNVDPAGSRTSQTQDELQRADNLGFFAQLDFALTSRWSAVAGLRYDRVDLDIDDRFSSPAGDRLGSGERAFDETSWTVGLNYRLSPDQQFYLNAGTAFETPTFTEIKDAAGGIGFSQDIDPQLARNFELGYRARWNEQTSLDLAVFRVSTRDEIVVVSSLDGLNLFDNAGRTERDGVELSVEHRLSDALSLNASYTWSRFRFESFRDGEEIFDGNRMPGLPENVLFAELAWRGAKGAYAIVDVLAVDQLFADNANEESVAGHAVVNTRFGREFDLGPQQLELFLALNNVTDRRYLSNVRVNATRGRYFEPAPERNA